MGKLVVVAIGGNSLIKENEHVTLASLYVAICETAKHIADLIQSGYYSFEQYEIIMLLDETV